MKAALYARISSDTQIDNFSISAQLKEIKNYCIKNSIEVYKEYVDIAVSGTKKNRPGLQELLNDCENFDIVLVHRFDRFARKVEVSTELKNILKKNDVKVVSITEPIEDSPIGFLQEGLLSLLSEYYIKNLKREVIKGQKERAKQGYHNGIAPFGYHFVNKKLVLDEEQAKIVKYIFDLYKLGLSTRKIAARLFDEGIKTHNNKLYINSRIGKMLKNVIYAGYVKHQGIIYEGKHEPIVDLKTFEYVQSEMKVKNSNPVTGRKIDSYKSVNYYLYYLLGILKCGNCGCSYKVITREYYNKYICSKAYNKKCENRNYYRTGQLEKEIETFLKIFKKGNPSVNITVKDMDNTKREILNKRLEKINKELERCKHAYLSEVFTIDEYKETKENLNNEIIDIKAELNKPQNYVNSNLYRKKFTAIWDRFYQERDIVKKRNILKEVISYIYLYHDKGIEIVFNQLD